MTEPVLACPTCGHRNQISPVDYQQQYLEAQQMNEWLMTERGALRLALDLIEAEPEDPAKVQRIARAALNKATLG